MGSIASFVAVLALISAAPAAQKQPTQPADWNDGRAEVDGYDLLQPRYGQIRHGTAVLVFVREDFSDSARVKADPGKHPPEDVFPVLKLNVVKSFQTGVYHYNLMTSAFTSFAARGERAAGSPAKVVFSNQEWCGTVFEELLFDARAVRASRFSYFDGEADAQRSLEYPADGVSVDTMPTLVRAIHGDALLALAPGKSRSFSVLPSLERTRLVHRTLAWHRGTLARGGGVERRTVPAGAFEVEVWTLDTGDGGDVYKYYVERAEPHRLIEWEGPEGERGRLTGSSRMKYWELHAEGDERYLKDLGLEVPVR